MKKHKILILIFTFLSILSLSACQIEKNSDFTVVVPEKVLMGDNSLEGFKIVKDDKEIALEKDMLTSDSLLAFYKEGKEEITVTYQNITKKVEINVVRRTFDSSVNLSDKTYEYTGEPIIVTVDGILPADVTIYYPLGNSFTNVGEYNITAIISAPYYTTLTFNATVKIVVSESEAE